MLSYKHSKADTQTAPTDRQTGKRTHTQTQKERETEN